MDEVIGPASHSYFSQRLRLHYVDWGNESAPPLLLVHGGRDHCRNWDWVAKELRKEFHIIAPDLRGHGDSQWAVGSSYQITDYVYDIAQLVHQKFDRPITIIGHSLGGSISVMYTGLFPETVKKLISIEGLGPPPAQMRARLEQPIYERMRTFVDSVRKLAGRVPRRYSTLDECVRRMQEANPHLTPERALHLTIHGVNQNEDGTYTWKFDNYVRAFGPLFFTPEEQQAIWRQVTCPTLVIYGKESWMSNPGADGRASHFADVRVEGVEGAGHWVHHDRLETFMALAKDFLGVK